MLSLSQNLNAQIESGYHKAYGYSTYSAFALATMLGGAFIGIADVLMFAAAGPFWAVGANATSLISGGVFGIGLILVIFAGGELATSAMMALPQAAKAKRISWCTAVRVLTLILLGNLIGSIIVAGIVAGSGALDLAGDPGQMLAGLVAAKTHKPPLALFLRGIMCNVLVCLAIWSQSRTENAVAKMILMAWCMCAFVASGFEHVVANMTTLALGVFLQIPEASAYGILKNLTFVGLGNLVGGAVFVGAVYYVIGKAEHEVSC